ncbi:hypothetical protein J6590_076337 [Homalodisca vitripennis]|nr:hypothetical protein J6590_076337 [Homalodisca vitripennis]
MNAGASAVEPKELSSVDTLIQQNGRDGLITEALGTGLSSACGPNEYQNSMNAGASAVEPKELLSVDTLVQQNGRDGLITGALGTEVISVSGTATVSSGRCTQDVRNCLLCTTMVLPSHLSAGTIGTLLSIQSRPVPSLATRHHTLHAMGRSHQLVGDIGVPMS